MSHPSGRPSPGADHGDPARFAYLRVSFGSGDRRAGKRTLATRLGDRGTRTLYLGLVAVALVMVAVVAVTATPWALFGLAGILRLAPAVVEVLRGADGPQLIPVLKITGIGELAYAVGLLLGFAA